MLRPEARLEILREAWLLDHQEHVGARGRLGRGLLHRALLGKERIRGFRQLVERFEKTSERRLARRSAGLRPGSLPAGKHALHARPDEIAEGRTA